MKKKVILFIIMLMGVTGAWAQMTFISEVKISAEEGKETNIQRLKDDGFTVIDQDLNQDAGGRYVYIGYKTTTNPAEAISGLVIFESGKEPHLTNFDKNEWEWIPIDVRDSKYKTTPILYGMRGNNFYNYYRCDSYGSNDDNCDLNRKAGGADITLYYTKDFNTEEGATLLTELTASTNKSLPGYSYVHHWKITSLNNWKPKDDEDVYGDANKGTGDTPIYLPCKYHTHSYSATYNWADDGRSCSVTARCSCGASKTGKATVTSQQKTQPTYRIDGITTYTAKINLHSKDFTGTKDVADIVMPLADAKTIVSKMIDEQVAAETRADMRSFGNQKKSLIKAAATRDEVLAILDAFPADLETAAASTLSETKSDAKAAIQAAVQGVTDEAILLVGSITVTIIDNATSVAQINTYKEDHLAEIQRLKELVQAKSDAKAAIQAALEGVTDEAILATGSTATKDIEDAIFIKYIHSIKSDALTDIQRLKTIAVIEALVDDTEDAIALSEADRYIALIRAAQTVSEVNGLQDKATRNLNSLLSDNTAVTFVFSGTSTPVETQHALKGVKMTYSADGEEMTVTINGAEVTYPLAQVSELTYFRGTPSVTLSTIEDPDHSGNYYTSFYSGLEAYTLPEGVTAYTSRYYLQKVILTAVEGNVLPQGKAVVLHSDVSGEVTMTVTESEGVSNDNGNAGEGSAGLLNNRLVGVDAPAPQDAASHYYMLASGEDGLHFYSMDPTMLLPANTALLPLASTVTATSIPLLTAGDNVGSTGIENINVDGTDTTTIYNLNGMPLPRLQQGINIVNGTKIINK